MRNNFKELNKRLDERELEIERLNQLLEDIKTYLKGYDYDKLTVDAKVMATNIELIIDGKIKVVK